MKLLEDFTEKGDIKMPLTFVVLFVLIIFVFILIWWICAGIFRWLGKIFNDDVQKFKKNWNEEKESE
jgi:uncharacterized ion transporter superfamily protein YfcC